MSLIVARATEKSVLILSDTRLTIRNKTLNPYLEGVSKIAMIDETRVVSFAGIVDYAINGIKEISQSDSDNQIIQRLTQITAAHQDDVEFIYASVKNTPQLFLIKKGMAIDEKVAWIGDYDGFSDYQKYFNSNDSRVQLYAESTWMNALELPDGENQEDAEVYSKMYGSLSAVIDGGVVSTVGGFVVPVITRNKKFCFGSYCNIFRRPLEMEELEATNGAVPFGNTSMGTFSVTLAHIGAKSFGAHIAQGEIGIVFHPKKSILPEPELYYGIDEIDYIASIKDRFGEECFIKIGNQPVHYYEKSNKLMGVHRYPEAVFYLTEGIKLSSKNWKGELPHDDVVADSLSEFMKIAGPNVHIPTEEMCNLSLAFMARGVCKYFMNDPYEAINDFRDSLVLSPDNNESVAWIDRVMAKVKG